MLVLTAMTIRSEAFLKDIFSVADELEVAADNRRGFGDYGSNDTRIHWLLNSLLLDRFNQATRTSLIRAATPAADVAWLISHSGRCKSTKDKRGTDKIEDMRPLSMKRPSIGFSILRGTL